MKKEILQKQSHSNFKSVMSKQSRGVDRNTVYSATSTNNQNYMTPNSMFDLQRIEITDFTAMTNNLKQNKVNIKIPTINLQGRQESFLHVPNIQEEDTNERNTSGPKRHRNLA